MAIEMNDTIHDWLPEDFEPIPFDCWDDEEALQDQADRLARLVL